VETALLALIQFAETEGFFNEQIIRLQNRLERPLFLQFLKLALDFFSKRLIKM
jgi:hypothetical protein